MMKKILIVLGVHLVTLLVLSLGPRAYAQGVIPAQTVVISGVSETVDEGSSLRYEFTRSAFILTALTFRYSVGFTQASSADFTTTSLSGSFTFRPLSGTTTALVISTANDTIVERDEEFTITFSSDHDTTFRLEGETTDAIPNREITVTITDNDTTTISLGFVAGAGVSTATTATEGTDDTVTLTASLTNQVAGAVEVTIAPASNSTATLDSDYTLDTTTITINANTNAGTASIAIVNDDLVEQDEIVEIFILGISVGSGVDSSAVINGTDGTTGENPFFTLTISDNDTTTVILLFFQEMISSTTLTVVEGANVTLATSFLTKQVDANVSLTLAVTTNSTATPSSDYTFPETITIPPHFRSSEITIAIVNDDVVERDEIVEIYISAITTAVNDGLPIGVSPRVRNGTRSDNPVTLTIRDTDFATVSLSFVTGVDMMDTEITATEGTDATVTLTASLTNQVAGAVTLTLAATADSAATPSSDYTLPETIRIAANTNEGTATIAIVNDNVVEQDEILKIYISALSVESGIASSAVRNGTEEESAVTLTIINDDKAEIALSLSSSTNIESGTIAVTAILSQGALLPTDLTVTLGSLDSTSPSNTYLATDQIDYSLFPPSLTFGPAEITATATITLLTDGITENTETFAVYIDTLVLTGFDPVTDFVINNTPEDTPVVVTILDNDSVTARFARPQGETFVFSEEIVSDAITVSLFTGDSQTLLSPRQLTDNVIVNVTTTDHSATLNADYSFTNQSLPSLTFRPTDSVLSQSFSLSFVDDTLIETNETFVLSLSSNSASVTATDVLTITLTDNDFVEVGFDTVSLTIEENAVPFISLTLTIPSGLTLVTDVSVPIQSIDSTATISNDYTLIADAILFDIENFASGTLSRTFDVTIIDDNVFEQTEQFFLNIIQPEDIILTLDVDRLLTIIILDDDQSSVVLSVVDTDDAPAATGAEGSTFSLEARLEDPTQVTSQTIIVFIGTTHATSTLNETDYSITRAISIPQGNNSIVSGSLILTDDEIFENNEILEIYIERFSIDGLTIGTPEDTPLVFTITDTDTVSLAFSFSEFIVDEDESFVFVDLTLQGVANSEKTVVARLNTTDGQATAGQDYIALTNQLALFDPGQLTRTISIELLADFNDTTSDAAKETFTLTASYETVTVDTLITLTQNAAVIAFTEPRSTVSESAGAVEVLVRAQNILMRTAQVQVSVDALATTAAPSDYSLNTASLTFNADNQSQNISIAIVDDSALENNEIIVLTLELVGTVAGVTLGSVRSYALTIIDNDQIRVEFSSLFSSEDEGVSLASLSFTLFGNIDDNVSFNVLLSSESETRARGARFSSFKQL